MLLRPSPVYLLLLSILLRPIRHRVRLRFRSHSSPLIPNLFLKLDHVLQVGDFPIDPGCNGDGESHFSDLSKEPAEPLCELYQFLEFFIYLSICRHLKLMVRILFSRRKGCFIWPLDLNFSCGMWCYKLSSVAVSHLVQLSLLDSYPSYDFDRG